MRFERPRRFVSIFVLGRICMLGAFLCFRITVIVIDDA